MSEALTKHGRPTIDPVRGALELCEEAGEVAAQALGATRGASNYEVRLDAMEGMAYELAQVAGFATLLLVSMEEVIAQMKRDRRSE
jgi:NTP pyrophosphatase (non-canonical NTP hydrolase)